MRRALSGADAQLRQIGGRTLIGRSETYDLGDGATESCGGRAQIYHAGDVITS